MKGLECTKHLPSDTGSGSSGEFLAVEADAVDPRTLHPVETQEIVCL